MELRNQFVPITTQLIGDEKKKFDIFLASFKNNGRLPYGQTIFQNDRIRLKDMLTSPDLARFLPRTIHTLLIEAAEPRLVVTSLFSQMELEKGIYVKIGAIGAIEASEIPEGAPWPIVNLSIADAGEALKPITITKHGMALPVTEEAIEEDQIGIINIWLKAAGRALARHKEKKAMQLLNETGTVLFDNADPTHAIYGSLTGRNIAGVQNGTMTFNDLAVMFGYVTMRNYIPNTLIMHPLAWMVFATDPLMREIMLKNGKIASETVPQGSPSSTFEGELPEDIQKLGPKYGPFGTGPGNGPDSFGRMGASAFTWKLNPYGATFYTSPDFLPVPLQVIVTPFAYYKEHGGRAGTVAEGKPTTHIIMCDSDAVGVLVQKSPIQVEDFEDPLRDIKTLKIGERYGFAIIDQGKAIVIAKNVIIDKNYVFDNVNSVTLAPISGVILA